MYYFKVDKSGVVYARYKSHTPTGHVDEIKVSSETFAGIMVSQVVSLENGLLIPTGEKSIAVVNDIQPIDLEALKSTRTTETKTALETYLAEHPLLWTDGKHYSVTMDKQALLNNAIAVYQLGLQAEIDPVLEWNATGEECIAWEFTDICALALGIAAYVKPLVSHQQALEVAIRAAETAEEVQAIEITYG